MSLDRTIILKKISLNSNILFHSYGKERKNAERENLEAKKRKSHP